MQEALQLEANVLVICCPKSLVMFEDALKSMPGFAKIVVQDLAGLIWEAVE